ncbi:MAG: hypothetical protein NZ898_08275 [Myxococcota bacterium]|nr:hypothetical protein [Myxococcota bacterium]MDW8364019.1 hypothetical protein [Myxococcales bacterium]
MFWVFVLVGLAATAAVTMFWHEVREWAQTALADFIGRWLGSDAREAFLEVLCAVDRFVTNVRRAVLQWAERLRALLLKATVAIERVTSNRYVKRLVAYVREGLEALAPTKVKKVTVTEDVAWEDLPDEIRAAFLRGESSNVVMELQPRPGGAAG